MRFLPSSATPLLLQSLLLLIHPLSCHSKAILGIDLGSLYMKVALVQRNAPLEIVTNLHSKRKTEQMILFDSGTRFYGADANSLLARKPHLTPTLMSVMLGRDEAHPDVKVLIDRHLPLPPTYNATRHGACVTIQGTTYTPEELIAMVLTHAQDITTAHGASHVKDCVLTVPSFFTQHERRALLDAATLAGLNVLALIDENTAAALHFGIDRIDEEPVNVMFYNMGASSLQVSIVRYGSYMQKTSKFDKKGKLAGAFEVIGKGWDATLGGNAFDNKLLEFMAAEYEEQRAKKGVTKDFRTNLKAMTKLRLQANKAKHILSANTDTPIFMEALADDIGYQSHISRAKFEEISHDLLLRATRPIEMALKSANLTMDEINMIELIGGGMRIPKVQEALAEMTKKELGMHINSDESMALGASFHGANVSTAFRVRHIGMTDVNPFAISVGLEDMVIEEEGESGGMLGNLFGVKKDAAKDGEEADAAAAEGDAEEDKVWSKSATVFKEMGKLGVKKTIAFTHDRDVNCKIDYLDTEFLPEGTELSIERFNITGIAKFAKEMEEKGLGKPKVSLQFELSTGGLTSLTKAEAAVEEIVQVEVDEDYYVEVTEEEEKSNETATETEEKKEEEATTGETEESKDEAKEEAKESEETTTEEAKEEEKKEETATEEGKEEEKKEGDATTTEETKDDATKEKAENATKKEKKPKKKKMTRKVTKDKKKVHKVTLTATSYHITKNQPYTTTIMDESKAKLANLARLDKERQMLEEIKNQVESYMYFIKNKLIDDEENIAKVTTEEQRETVSKLASDTEDWMYEDGYDADYATYSDKYVEISTPMEAILFRLKELTARPDAIASLSKKLEKVEDILKKWETDKPHVTAEDKAPVTEEVEKVRTWIKEMEEKQAAIEPWDKAAFESKDVPGQAKEIEKLMQKLNKKPKPKPKKNETEAANETASADATGEEETTAGEGEASTDEAAAEGETTTAEGEEAAEGETKTTTDGEGETAATDEEKKEDDEL